ncbi:DUF6882 domain-containing protein [Amphritea sp. HPY]|uniref:DUF6882 domain-containing protein n=1 Tax=Amphritea sp. HPY TaxID=3421652 RepID=UPI003D7D23CB
MSDPITEEEWNNFLHEAYLRLSKKQESLMQEYNLSDHKRFNWDQESGSLIFSSDGDPTVIAQVQFVGSVSTQSDTWLWSWANTTVLDNVKNQMHRVREYGDAHGYSALTADQWSADEIDGWEMTSVTARILKARGAYRTRTDNGFTYMVITEIRWAN